MKLYSVHDKVALTYACPSNFLNDGVARRQFIELMSTPDFNFSREDYELYLIGEFDVHSGIITVYPEKTLICKGSDERA